MLSDSLILVCHLDARLKMPGVFLKKD